MEPSRQAVPCDHVAERAATLAFFDSLPDAAWARQGVASGNTFTVRALAYIAAGHVTHHDRILRTRYLEQQAASGV